MLGLGASAAALPIKQWEPTDHPRLELWLQAHGDFFSYGSDPVISRWRARYPSGGSHSYEQATVANQPAYNDTTGAVDFETDPSGSNDEVLLEADDQITLDTSDGGWTMAFVATCTDWNGSHQVFFGEKDTNDNFVRATNAFDGFGLKMGGTLKTVTLDTPSSLTDNTFYHIMVSADSSGTVTFYINNVAQLDTEEFGTVDFVLDEIGGKNNLSQSLNGSIKEIQVFNTELSSLEREECYKFMTNRAIGHSS